MIDGSEFHNNSCCHRFKEVLSFVEKILWSSSTSKEHSHVIEEEDTNDTGDGGDEEGEEIKDVAESFISNPTGRTAVANEDVAIADYGDRDDIDNDQK